MHDDDYKEILRGLTNIYHEFDAMRRKDPDFQRYIDFQAAAYLDRRFAEIRSNWEDELRFCMREIGDYDYDELLELDGHVGLLLSAITMGRIQNAPSKSQACESLTGSAGEDEDDWELFREDMRRGLAEIAENLQATAEFFGRDVAEFTPEELQTLVDLAWMTVFAICIGELR